MGTYLSDNIVFIFGNTLLSIGMVLFSYATSNITKQKNSLKNHIIIYCISFLIMIIFKYIYPVKEIRQLIMSVYIIYVMSSILMSASKYLNKEGFKFLTINFIGSLVITVLHLIRIIFIIFDKNDQTLNFVNMTFDQCLLVIVGVLVIIIILTMTIYINYKSVVDLKHERHNLELASMTDYLTQLPNRRMLFSFLENLVSKKKKFALIMTDVDEFKNINDQYGHDIGDLVIQEFGKLLVKTTRPQDFVCRYGGDEFIIIVEDYQTEETLYQEVNKKINELKNTMEIASIKFSISSSVGISLFPFDGENYTELIKKADNALYYVKTSAKNKIVFYQDLIKQEV